MNNYRDIAPRTTRRARTDDRHERGWQSVEPVIRAPPSMSHIVPPTSRAVLSYCYNANFTTPATSTAIDSNCFNVFNASSCYDPDTTGVGSQPLGFDQWMAFYDHFTVKSSKIRVIGVSNSSNPVMVGVRLTDSTSSIADSITFVEQANATFGVGGNLYNHGKELNLKYDIHKFFGVRDLLDATEYKGSAGGNPSENAYFHVAVFNPQSTQSSTASGVYVYITYDVVFSERKALSAS